MSTPSEQIQQLQQGNNEAQQQQLTKAPLAHAPSVAGSVIEAPDGLGGTILIRIQNIASTGKLSPLSFNDFTALILSYPILIQTITHSHS